MLRGVWQALNCLSIRATYCVIVAGASPNAMCNKNGMIKYSKINIDVLRKERVLSFFLNVSRVAARLMFVGEGLLN